MTITLIPWEGVQLQYMEWDEWVPPKYPVVGPAMTWPDNTTQAFHYTAAINLIDGDPGERWDRLDEYIAAIHIDYTLHRPQYDIWGNVVSTGYSIGYNHGIDQRGVIWKLRGWDIACAANKGWNPYTYATLCFVDHQDHLSAPAKRAARYLHWKGEQLAKKSLYQRPHSVLKSDGTVMVWPGNVSGCPGNGIRDDIITGQVNWRYIDLNPDPTPPNPTPIPPTPVPVPTEEEDMFTAVICGETPDYHPVLLTIAGNLVGMTGLTDPDDCARTCKKLGQTAPIIYSDSLWVDFFTKATGGAFL